MENSEILIIGAGAAGLMAARILAKAGKKVTVLEARNRCGGRIYTLYNESFFNNAELGAEFIHGDLPVTLHLLKEADIKYSPANAEMWYYKAGKFDNQGGFMSGWDLLMEKLEALKHDTSIEEFLQQHLPGEEHDELKKYVRRFVSGYDTADPCKASAFALRTEWGNDDDAQHRVRGGYGQMIKYLENEVAAAGGNIYLNSVVKEIQWQPGNVKVLTGEGVSYTAAQILIALPLGVLQADEHQKGAVSFVPPVVEHSNAIKAMGFGAIIKILMEFDEPFWIDKQIEELAGKNPKNMGFIISDEEIPTWWTQAPDQSSVLTGWLGGNATAQKKNVSDEDILQQSLQSLSVIFKRNEEVLKRKLIAFNIANWTNDPFTRGSYGYDTIAAPQSRTLLNTPIDNTLFFTGEYLYAGAAMGTVEAALANGEEVAKRMIDNSNN